MYSVQSVGVIDRMRIRAEQAAAEDGQPVGFDFITIATLIVQLLPALSGIFAACKKQPPAPTPVPAALAAVGVTAETWDEACRSKYLAESSRRGDRFAPGAVIDATRSVMQVQGVKRKAAKPKAVSALKTSYEESVEDLAVAFQAAKSNHTA